MDISLNMHVNYVDTETDGNFHIDDKRALVTENDVAIQRNARNARNARDATPLRTF